MKITKRIVSLLLALLLVFGNVSLLASAATSDKTTVRFKYYREVDGEWVETNKIARGDTVKARLYMSTTFDHEVFYLFFAFPNSFMTHEYTHLEADAANDMIRYLPMNQENSQVTENTYQLNVVTNADAVMEQLVDDGGGEYEPYLPASFFDEHDWMTSLTGQFATPFKITDDNWLAEYQFKVSDNATGEGQVFVPEEAIMAPGDQEAAVVYIAKKVGNKTTLSMNEAFTWDVADTNVLTLDNTVTFDAGKDDEGKDNTLTGTATYTDYIGTALGKITDFEVPTASQNGKIFKGWSLDGATVLSETEIKALTVDYEPMTLKAVYEAAEATYIQNVYTMGTDGKYGEAAKSTPAASTGDVVKAADYTVPAGFTLDTEKSTAGEVTVTSDGNATLDIYLKRNTYAIAFGDATENLYYEATYTAPEGPKVDGKKFTGWLGSDGTTLAAGDTATVGLAGVTYTAQYVSAETTVAIKVKYNDLANGGAEKIVDHATVDTIAGYTVALAAADEGAEKTTYYLIDNLPEITHYEYDAAATTTTVTAAEDGSSVLYAVYKPVTYTAAFEGAQTFADVAYYTEITVPAGPEVAGKTFTGWLGSDGSTPEVGAKLNVAGDVTYTAQYDNIVYTATYSFTGEAPEDAVVPAAETGIKGDEIVLEDPAAVPGWTFNGWTVTGATATDGKYYFNTSDVTIKGTWTQNVYTARYWLDGAMTDMYDYQEYYYGDMIELLDAPEAPAGKEFVGWDCGFASMPAQDIDIIAQYNDLYYSVTVKLPEGTETLYEATTYGTVITEEDLADYEELDGYTFVEWRVAGKKVTLPYSITGNTVFVANATINTWDLYFWATQEDYDAFEAGEMTSDDAYKFVADVEYGSRIDTLAPVDPELKGHVFSMWDMELSTMEDSDMHFVATYDKESYTVIWDNDGATVQHEYEYDETLVIPEVSKTGYTFKGWSGLEEGTTKMPDAGDNGATVTYTAVWEANTYDAKFYLDDEKTELYETVPTKFNEQIVAPTAPTKSGYDFAGWAPAVGRMDDVNGKEFVATWTAKGDTPYTVNVYTMDTKGEYGTPVVHNLTAATDSPATFTPEIANGFSLNANSVTSGTVTADGNLVLNIWIDRNTYTLTTVVDGETKTADYLYDAAVAVETPSKEGHSFAWDKEVPATMPADNVTLIGTFTALQYDLVYMVDGQQYNSEKVTYGTPVTVIDAPTKEGYTFSGWDKTGTFNMPAETVTISGTFTVNTHDVIYMVDGAEYDRTEGVAFGTEVTAIDAPTKEGYTFSGWDKTTFTMPDDDVTVSGTFTVNTHDVIYMVDGDEYDRTENVAFGTNVTAIDAPTKEGYTFSGWDKTEFTMPDDDVTVSGTFTVNTHDVIYMVDGVEYARVEDVAYGTPVTVLADLEETGKTFSGWTINGAPAEDFTMPDSDVTIVGSWTVNSFTVTYYTDKDKTDVHFTYTGAYGAEYNIPLDPEMEGHKFLGWANVSDDADAGLPAAGTIENVPLNGAEYYATWETLKYKLVYAAGTDAQFSDGATQKTYDVAYGTPKAEWPVPTEELSRPGYTFGGWNLDAAPATMGTTPVRVAANWVAIPYTVTWINGDDEPVVNNYTYGDEIIAPELDEREGWTFEGWLEADGETIYSEGDLMGEKSLVYTAQWTGNEGIEYTVYRYFENVAQDGWMDGAEAEALTGKKAETVLTGKAGEPAEVDAAAEAVNGFTIDTEGSTLSAEILGNGTTALVIKYYRETVSVTVKDPEGETYIDDTFVYGKEITLADPTKEGHEFVEWKDEDGNVVTFPMTAPADDIVINPVWSINKYTITFVDDDGSVIEAAKEVEFGSAIVAPTDPEKDGYNFAYWIDADTGAIIPATMPAKNATYKAYYTAGEDTTYYIEVYMMDASGSYTMASRTVATGTTGDPISVTPGTITGCTHDADLSVLTGVITADGKATLKVYYARNNYTVTFKSGDGVFADDATVVGPTNVLYGAAVPVPAQPTREGYIFAGWDAEVPAAMPAENLTFTATWTEAEYTITYVVNGEVKDVVSYKFGETVATPENPVVDGMTFIKWNPVIPSTMPAKDLVIVAAFEVSVYKATFLVDGVVYDQFMVGHGDEIPVPAEDPKKEFYTFAGWANMPEDGRMPAVDVEITATFERVPVKLVPMAGSTTVIDTDAMAIYGIGLYATEAKLRSSFLAVEGDGYFTVAPSQRTACGTGTVIELYDNVTGELLETYTIVVFGDLNGDSKISIDDNAIAQAEYDWFTSWSAPSSSEYDMYKTMAADFNGDKYISNGEAADIERYVLGTVTIDQTTGAVTHN